MLCGALTPAARRDLLLGLITLKYTQSNSVGYSLDGQMIGIGAGQQSRVDCTKLAGSKADVWHLRRHPKVLGLRFKQGVGAQDRINFRVRYIEGDLVPSELAAFEEALDQPFAPLTAAEKAGVDEGARGVSLTSDAFFPFRDNIDHAARHGVAFVAHPGGSARDDEVTAAVPRVRHGDGPHRHPPLPSLSGTRVLTARAREPRAGPLRAAGSELLEARSPRSAWLDFGRRDQGVVIAPATSAMLRASSTTSRSSPRRVGLADLAAALGEEGVQPVALKGGVRRDRSERGPALGLVAGLFAQLARARPRAAPRPGRRCPPESRASSRRCRSGTGGPSPLRRRGVSATTLTQSAHSSTTASNGAEVRGET